MNLKYDKAFSVIDIDNATYLKWRSVTPFYQNCPPSKEEGVRKHSLFLGSSIEESKGLERERE